MRTSCDIYKTADNRLVPVSGGQQPPEGATIYTGYDYANQRWMLNGEPDTRTLAELQASVKGIPMASTRDLDKVMGW